jgi:hypothetical protein
VPDRSAHLAKAAQCEAFARWLESAGNARREWEAVAIFYAALHYIDAYLATHGFHLADHAARRGYVGRVAALRPITGPYRHLYDLSQAARYRDVALQPSDVPSCWQDLARIKQEMHSLGIL